MTRLVLFGLILISVMLAAAAQLTLKVGMSSAEIQRTLAGPDPSLLKAAIAAATSTTIIAGLLCFGLSAITWLLVLARLDLSTAYPMVALGIVVTVASGYFFLGEAVSPTKLVGVAAIICGVMLIGLSTPRQTQSAQQVKTN